MAAGWKAGAREAQFSGRRAQRSHSMRGLLPWSGCQYVWILSLAYARGVGKRTLYQICYLRPLLAGVEGPWVVDEGVVFVALGGGGQDGDARFGLEAVPCALGHDQQVALAYVHGLPFPVQHQHLDVGLSSDDVNDLVALGVALPTGVA